MSKEATVRLTREEFDRVEKLAWEEIEPVINSAWEEDVSLEEYVRIINSAWKVYQRAIKTNENGL